MNMLEMNLRMPNKVLKRQMAILVEMEMEITEWTTLSFGDPNFEDFVENIEEGCTYNVTMIQFFYGCIICLLY